MSEVRKRIPLYDIRLSPKAIREATDTLESGWLSPGPKVNALEKALSKLLGCPHVIGVCSATDGLMLALKAAGARPGSEVITTPYTFVGTIEAIRQTGATPIFTDICPETLNIDPEKIRGKITDRTAAVVPVDIAGLPCDYGSLGGICRSEKIALVSDSAHAVGSRYKQRHVSAYTNFSVISLHATKNLIGGEGGVILARSKRAAEVVRLMSRHGLTSSAFQRKGRGWEYDGIVEGFKANMSELHAAVALGQLSVFEAEQKKRTRLAERYIARLKHLGDRIGLPSQPTNTTHGWHLFIIRLKTARRNVGREQFIQAMASRGIECGVHYRPIFELSYYKKRLRLNADDTPHAAAAGKCAVTLPLYPALSARDIDYISECVSQSIA